jgi:hypothetical protein
VGNVNAPRESAPIVAQILLDGGLPADHEHALVAALAGCGITAELRDMPPRRGPLEWLLLIALPLQAFLTALGTKGGESAYPQLIAAVRAILRRHLANPDPDAIAPHPEAAAFTATTPPVLILQDPATGVRIVLEDGLPEDAYRQLLTLDISAFRIGPVHYDAAKGRWRSEQDEAQRPKS